MSAESTPLLRMYVSSSMSRKILWGSKIQQSPPTVTYEEAMSEDDRGLYRWLSNVVSTVYMSSYDFIYSYDII